MKKENKKINSKKRNNILIYFLILFLGIILGLICYKLYDIVSSTFINNITTESYKIISYKAGNNHLLRKLDNKYIIETKLDDSDYYIDYYKEKYLKIMDMETNVIFEGKVKGNIELGLDNKIYSTFEKETNYSRTIEASVLEKGKFKKVFSKTITWDENNYPSSYIVKIEHWNNGTTYLVGHIDEQNQIIYLLNGKSYQLDKNLRLTANNERQAADTPLYTEKGFKILISKNNNKGLFDLEHNKILIKPQYEELIYHNNNYIAVKDNKAGIIDENNKILVDFQYDFIDKQEDGYVVGKNHKVAVMDTNYNLVTDFDFSYNWASGLNEEYNYFGIPSFDNTFQLHKINNKYILTITDFKGIDNGLTGNEDKDSYIIDGKTFRKIAKETFVVDGKLIYSFNPYYDEKATFYDNNLNVKYEIKNIYCHAITLIGNTIKADVNNIKTYDFDTGKEVDGIQDYKQKINGIDIVYNGKTNEEIYMKKDEEIARFDLDKFNKWDSVKEYSKNKIVVLSSNQYLNIQTKKR